LWFLMSFSFGATPLDREPRTTALNARTNCLSVLTYNTLAPIYVRPVDTKTGEVMDFATFTWARDEYLDWEVRCPAIVANLCAANADVICLQEVQFENVSSAEGQPPEIVVPAWIANLHGYRVIATDTPSLLDMAARNLRRLNTATAVGNALLIRTDRLEILDSKLNDKKEYNTNTLISAVVRGKEGSGLAHLQPTALYCVHLDATDEDKRVKLFTRCMARTRALGLRSMVLAGDLNSELSPASCLAATLHGVPLTSAEEQEVECARSLRLPSSQKPSPAELKAWTALRLSAASARETSRLQLERAATGPTRAAYDHGCDAGPCVSWRLDHVCFTPRFLRLVAAWRTLEAYPESARVGLPNQWEPSDHMAVGCVFEVVPAETLGETEAKAMLERLDALEAQQSNERHALQMILREREAEVLRSMTVPSSSSSLECFPADSSTGADAKREELDTTAKKHSKQKKEAHLNKAKPAPELIELKRHRRAQEKECAERQRAVRAAMWESLTELQRDALEDGGRLLQLT
jgi:endonuclease/exonuclease/phosphatase family metal-dependent hydrolase